MYGVCLDRHLEDIREGAYSPTWPVEPDATVFRDRTCPWRCAWWSRRQTAKSAADVAEGKLLGVGAVASSLAAERFGLEILKENIETYKQNFTRFLVMDDSIVVPQEKVNKVSVCFTLPHSSGSLAKILTILSFYDMNLTRIQSLPHSREEVAVFLLCFDIASQRLQPLYSGACSHSSSDGRDRHYG